MRGVVLRCIVIKKSLTFDKNFLNEMKRIQLEMNNTRGPNVNRQKVNKLLELRTFFCLPKRFCLQHADRSATLFT